MELPRRLQGINAAIFSELDDLGRRLTAAGRDVINLSIGSPDLPPAPHIVQALHEALDEPNAYRYALSEGLPEFKQAVADWYGERFGVELDPRQEVLSLMGSQDGLAHMYLALLNPGDIAMVPDPGYPIYSVGAAIAGGNVYPLPLLAENSFLPDLEDVPIQVARRAKVMVLNYPSNPLAATAEVPFFEEVVAFARRYDIVVVHDAAYSELAFDGYCPPSFLQARGARDVGVEFHSLSKTYNMAGCRLAFAVGNAKVLDALRLLKSNIDFGVFRAIQRAGVSALRGPQDGVRQTMAAYQRRRDILVDGLAGIGWHMPRPRASMFLWAPLPVGWRSSRDFALTLGREAQVLVVPGIAFGERGEGYVRLALVGDDDRLQEATQRPQVRQVIQGGPGD